MMLVLLSLMTAVVVFRSPYAPVVGGPVDIEVLWEIEDTRVESEEPLVTAMENYGTPLAYDRENNTFYCTLGMENDETWPPLHLTVSNAGGKKTDVLFSDDYTYDWCNEAIAEGYSYELMAYTDTEYAYFNLVFTALPQLCIDTQGRTIAEEDVPIRLSMVQYGEEALESTGRIRLRGASSRLSVKKGYKIEFTRQRDGKDKKTMMNTPILGAADQVALLPCVGDTTRMRDKLSWDLYEELAADEESFGARRTEYVEVFRDDTYLGLYLMVEPVDVEAELKLSSDRCLATDSVYRTATLTFAKGRDVWVNPLCKEMGYELYYAPQGSAPFADLEAYMNLIQEEDDAAFCARALECIDTDSMLRHVLLIQAGAMADNVFNNMYIWAHRDGKNIRYRFACWDMDWTWGFKREEIGEEYENWLYFPVADRLLNLNANGIRQRLYEQWSRLRETFLNEQWLEEKIEQYNTMLRESGALAREEARWNFEAEDGYGIVVFASVRWPILDKAIAEMAENPDEAMPYLSSSRYDGEKGASML